MVRSQSPGQNELQKSRRHTFEPGAEGFEGIAEGQTSSPYQIEEVQAAAMHFASYALVSPVFFTCAGWSKLSGEPQTTCALRSLEKFTQRAYRRPITPPEKQRLQALWQANLAEGGQLEDPAAYVSKLNKLLLKKQLSQNLLSPKPQLNKREVTNGIFR